jgi:hypothetical protein
MSECIRICCYKDQQKGEKKRGRKTKKAMKHCLAYFMFDVRTGAYAPSYEEKGEAEDEEGINK